MIRFLSTFIFLTWTFRLQNILFILNICFYLPHKFTGNRSQVKQKKKFSKRLKFNEFNCFQNVYHNFFLIIFSFCFRKYLLRLTILNSVFMNGNDILLETVAVVLNKRWLRFKNRWAYLKRKRKKESKKKKIRNFKFLCSNAK